MQELWKHLTSPRHLIVFEAAARHGSFTRAASELNVRQPAVSAAIKQMELSLGVQLFQRIHKKVELTGPGRRLFIDVSNALEQILSSVQAVRTLGKNDHVTLSASSAFTYYWMVPRLKALGEAHPGIDLRLQSSHREPDIDAENISLAIRRGRGTWPGCHSALIAEEVIFPVASPRFMAANSSLNSVADLLDQRLIHLEEPVRERPSWKQWFEHFDVGGPELTSGLRLNDYALVLQAAIAGEGVAFGWRHVTHDLISQKLLEACDAWSWSTGMGFYLVWSSTRPLLPHAAIVRDWMIAQGEGVG